MFNRWKRRAFHLERDMEEYIRKRSSEEENIENNFLLPPRRLKEKRLQTIEIDQSEFVLNPTTLETFIVKVLCNVDYLHINDIIFKIEALGWKSKSAYHKYSVINKALNNNVMFMRTGKGTYKLREGFKCNIPKKIARAKKSYNTPIPTLKDIVSNVINQYKQSNKYTDVSPTIIHNLMRKMGYNCSYSSVRRAMQ